MPAWESTLRAKFPALRLTTYLNSAAVGPLAMETARAGFDVYESLLQSGGDDFMRHVHGTEEARATLAALLGCESDAIAFTRNTSHGAALVAEMLWQQGRRTAVALQDEFPASTLPFLHRGFDIHFVQPVEGRYRLADIERAIVGRDLLIASHVLFSTGQALDPVATTRIAHAAGAMRLLCVTQSLGALQVDVDASRADFAIGTSHKWLCGGVGAGYLVIRRDLWPQLRWPMVGWLSQPHPWAMRADTLDLEPRPRALEMGTAATPTLLAAGAAARLWLEAGPDRIEARIRQLTVELRERLRASGFHAPAAPWDELSGITVVPVDQPHEVVANLSAAGVSTTPRGAGVRLSVHAFNNAADLDKAVSALRTVVDGMAAANRT